MPTDPISILGMKMILDGNDPSMVNGLCAALRDTHTWSKIDTTSELREDLDPQSLRLRLWETVSGDWNIKVFDFPIGDQPGHKPGERGQNLTCVNGKTGLILLADTAGSPMNVVWADIAKILFKEISGAPFLGSGSVPTKDKLNLREARQALAKRQLDLRNPEHLKLAVKWQTDHVNKIKEGDGWQIESGGHAIIRLWHSRKAAQVAEGVMRMDVRIVFYAMGWAIENDTVSDHDDMMCHLWASLYEP